MPDASPSCCPPYRIKVVEPIPFLTAAGAAGRRSTTPGYNPFNLRADQITIDLLSDSGTGATSAAQEAAAAVGDESYAGARSWFRFRDEVRRPHRLSAHPAGAPGPGRRADPVLQPAEARPALPQQHPLRHHPRQRRAGRRRGPRPALPGGRSTWTATSPFKGNIDLAALERTLAGPDGDRVGLVLMTITNNGLGAQPVSMANLAAVRGAVPAPRRAVLPGRARASRRTPGWSAQREPGYARLDARGGSPPGPSGWPTGA